MKLSRILFSLAAFVCSAFAGYHDLHFHQDSTLGKLLVSKTNVSMVWRDDKGSLYTKMAKGDVRIRIIDPKQGGGKFGFVLQRPFLILDGIYLSNDGKRNLSAFQEEAEQFGLPTLLKELGYTPILVQFAETVEKSLEENSGYFANLLQFMNDNAFFGFENKRQDGFVVMGISQGGILGRYGSYLYDTTKSSEDAPIRLYASLDSPHQGAILPMGLYLTLDFWAKTGGSADAEAFRDLIGGDGASGLLLYQKDSSDAYKNITGGIKPYFSSDRFLFGEYRKAAEYKGFPSVLVSQGLFKGSVPSEKLKFYDLSRKATKAGLLFGRAASTFSVPKKIQDTLARNRLFRKFDDDYVDLRVGLAKYDLIQGSTYPFAKTIYESLRDGFCDAMPDNMEMKLFSLLGKKFTMDLKSSWDADTLYHASSTFIPTTSAMDMKCGGELSIKDTCSFIADYNGFPFENPENRSSANAVFAVDPTHPRFNEKESGRHIELPGFGNRMDTTVLRGMQVDIYRLLCEVAKYDYDDNAKSYRNENLTGVFSPGKSCVDPSNMPDVIRNSGIVQRKKFGFARYDYSQKSSEANDVVSFKVPAGWHKVALFDNGEKIPEGSTFEVVMKVREATDGWFKTELLLTKTKGGSGQVQLQEISVPADGESHVIRWKMPAAEGSLNGYRWFRLVANSNGSDVEISEPRLANRTVASGTPKSMASKIYPSTEYTVRNWNENIEVRPYSDAFGSGLYAKFKSIGDNFFIDFGNVKSLKYYKELKISYWPGTCQATKVYFDSYVQGAQSLVSQNFAGNFIETIIPLEKIVNKDFSVDNDLSASRLVLRGTRSDELCFIRDINLQ